MQMKDLQPASALAQRYGVKALAYGPPGKGKTPLIKTAPRPVLLAVEPGLGSMRDAHNIPAWEAYTPDKINEFFTWLLQSAEARNFDTVGIDSISQLAEIILTEELARNKDGRKAYGEMSRRVMTFVNALYFLPNKNVYLIAKQFLEDANGVKTVKPYFPGQDLNVKVPHLYDGIWHIDETNVPGQTKPVVAVRTKGVFGILARDRYGKLDELEPPHLGNIFAKSLA